MEKEQKDTTAAVIPFRWGAISDTGRVREENQDAYFAGSELGLFLVSDGMGGHQAGALASKIVAEVLPAMIADQLNNLKTFGPRAIKSMLEKAIIELSRRMRTESANQTGFKGMGATLVMALLREKRAYIANMGDSRAYLFRKRKLTQLSEDHSVVALLLRSGEIKPEEAKNHPSRGQLSRYIGMLDEVYPYISTKSLKKGDRLILCTDGLSGIVSSEEITNILKKHSEPKVACQILVDAANAAGGHDNVTVVIVDWLEPHNSLV